MSNIKEAYEKLNNIQREGTDFKYQELMIPSDVKIKEISLKEAIKVMNTSHALIYFGANWCPWCRMILPVIMKIADDPIIPVYYVDMDEKRPVYELIEGKVTLTKKGDEAIKELYAYLDPILKPHPLDEKIKGMPIPLVIACDKGRLSGYHYGAVTLKEGQNAYDILDQDEEAELSEIYHRMFEGEMIDSDEEVCDINGSCKLKERKE